MLKSVSKRFTKLPSARVGAGSYRATLVSALVVILPLTLLLLENASAFTARLVFSTKTQVNTSKIYLDDIIASAEGSGLLKQKARNIIVASAPIPGKVKVIKRPQVVRALSKHNLTTGDTKIFIPEEIKVTRKSQTFQIKDIETIIRAELLKRNFIDKNNTAFKVDEVQKDIVLPLGNVKTYVKVPGRIKDHNKFWVSFYIDGKLKNRIWAKGTIKRNLEVLSVNKDINANDIITEADLTYVKRNILELSGNYITNKRAVIGKKALRNLKSGAILKKEVIGSAPSVKAGDIVNIKARIKNLQISAYGKVLTREGAIGDTVTVLNIDSKETLQAIVLNRKTVEVEVH
jgi:flagella basal body P-ring formation protein FlgA